MGRRLRLAISITVILAVFLSGIFVGKALFEKSPEEVLIEDTLTRLKGYRIIVEENRDFPDFAKWIKGAEKAASLLPSDVLFTITFQNGYSANPFYLTIGFIEIDYWGTGNYNCWENKIRINTTPDPNHPFPFEHISENGYTDEEILYVFLHEMGHAFDYSRGEETWSNSKFYQWILEKEKSPSLYAYYHRTDSGLVKLDKINPIEDFAESFAFYVLLPDYLKKNFPLRYDWFKNIVFDGIEYESAPSSIRARLTAPLT